MGLFLIYKTGLEIQAECFISGCVLFKLLPKNKTTDNQHVSQRSGCSVSRTGKGCHFFYKVKTICCLFVVLGCGERGAFSTS